MEILHKVYHASRPQIHILNMMELIWRMIENEWLKDWQEKEGDEWKYISRRPSSLSERLDPIQIQPIDTALAY